MSTAACVGVGGPPVVVGGDELGDPAALSADETSDDGGDAGACALREPVVSDDPCASDDECAPATPCHAPRCVAVANAPPAPSDAVCTKVVVCDTVDANRCACLHGRCALMPRRP